MRNLTKKCFHIHGKIKTNLGTNKNTGEQVLKIRAFCLDCGISLTFKGFKIGVGFKEPLLDPDGVTLSLPVEPVPTGKTFPDFKSETGKKLN